MANQDTEAAMIEIDVAIKHIKTAQAMANDARLALIRADRKFGPIEASNNLSGHIKQLEVLIKEHGDCAMFIEATLALMKGEDTDVEVVQGR